MLLDENITDLGLVISSSDNDHDSYRISQFSFGNGI